MSLTSVQGGRTKAGVALRIARTNRESPAHDPRNSRSGANAQAHEAGGAPPDLETCIDFHIRTLIEYCHCNGRMF